LWGRRELLETLPAYKVRPAPNSLPGKWMTGTQSHESIAGALAAIDYLADVGREVAASDGLDRRAALQAAFTHIMAYEQHLSCKLLNGFANLASVKLWGPPLSSGVNARVPTFSITHDRLSSSQLADLLGKRGLFVWHGNYYALNLSEALGHEPEGMVRIGAVHYNTEQEIAWLLEVLQELE
jgi:selenocysteine lyase/cysteine desulfurase